MTNEHNGMIAGPLSYHTIPVDFDTPLGCMVTRLSSFVTVTTRIKTCYSDSSLTRVQKKITRPPDL